jgi:hypothetical protein
VGPVGRGKTAEVIPLVNPASAGEPRQNVHTHGFVKYRG